MTDDLRKRLIDRIRDLALHDDEVAEIMNEVLGYSSVSSDDRLSEMYCNAEGAIICEIVK